MCILCASIRAAAEEWAVGRGGGRGGRGGRGLGVRGGRFGGGARGGRWSSVALSRSLLTSAALNIAERLCDAQQGSSSPQCLLSMSNMIANRLSNRSVVTDLGRPVAAWFPISIFDSLSLTGLEEAGEVLEGAAAVDSGGEEVVEVLGEEAEVDGRIAFYVNVKKALQAQWTSDSEACKSTIHLHSSFGFARCVKNLIVTQSCS